MKRFLTIVSMALLVLSCGKKQLETTYDTQEKSIQSIVESLGKSNPDATTEYVKGSVKVTVVQGEGEALQEGGAVSFYYAGYQISGTSLSSGNLFATNNEEFAGSIGWRVSDSTSFAIKTIDLSKDDLVEGLRNGLVGVRGGDECYILFSGKHGFGKKNVGNVPPRAGLAYHLWIKSVSND